MIYHTYKMCFWNEKDFFKLMNHSVYAKTIKKIMNVRLVNSSQNYGPYKNDLFGMKKKQKDRFKIFHFIINSMKNHRLNVLIT